MTIHPNKNRKGLHSTFKSVVLILVLIFIGAIAYHYKDTVSQLGFVSTTTSGHPDIQYEYKYLPSSTGEVIHHTYYSLSYQEAHEQPEWVAYILTRKSLQVPNVSREKYFVADDSVSTISATSDDYKNSGYTRGHLVPAGDMAFDTLAMRESFLMSNISPQLRQLNNGIWRDLEEHVRDWTYHADTLYVISGPILTNPIKKIGRKNKVSVPNAFYKVLLDNKGPEKKAIGFIIPHELSEKRLETYMVSVSDIEALTGLKFFDQMPNHAEILQLKSSFDPSKWKISDKRYQLRVKKWNYE